MLTEQENQTLTQVGPGTPGGELHRRYWHPVAVTTELERNATKRVRLLGEDLVLYRDRSGNLVFRESARNFNPLCATAGRVTIAQVEHLVDVGEIRPEEVHTPGVFVQRVVEVGPDVEKRIERRTTRPRRDASTGETDEGKA